MNEDRFTFGDGIVALVLLGSWALVLGGIMTSAPEPPTVRVVVEEAPR